MSYDQDFKNLILDYPRETIAFLAGEEAAALDETARIVPIRQEQLKERLGERFRELDVPLLVEWPNGEREALLFVIEEDTDPRRFSIHRLSHYCLDLAEMFETNRVVPVVVFVRSGHAPTQLSLGGERHTYLHFEYLATHLARLPYERYRDSDNLVARVNLPNMAWSKSEKIDVYAQAVRGLLQLEPDPERRLKYIDFIDIYAQLDDNEYQQYQRLYPEESNAMTRFAERFRDEGVQQGEAQILMRLLEHRFGPLSDDQRQRIEGADADTLLDWSERVLSAQSVEEVLAAT